jgi:hypothetical protein
MSQPKITIDPSFRRRPESSAFNWTPAFAGETTNDPSFRRTPESSMFKDALNKLVCFVLRQAQDERNQARAVRPELVEGLVQRFLNWTPAFAGVTTNCIQA